MPPSGPSDTPSVASPNRLSFCNFDKFCYSGPVQPHGPPRARRGPRGASRLEGVPAWQALLVALSQKAHGLIRQRGCSIRRYARDAGLTESAVQDILKTASDPKLSTLYMLARVSGCSVYLFFEPDGRGRTSVDG